MGTIRKRVILAALAGILLSCQLLQAESFDWRNYNGEDYTTPIKNQGRTAACWAFAAVGALESKLEITAQNPDWNPDVSEQHLICDGTAGSATTGGWEHKALGVIKNIGLVSEAELPFTASNTSPDWPLDAGWENRRYTITAYDDWLPSSNSYLKQALQTYGPLVAGMQAATTVDPTNDWYWPTGDALIEEMLLDDDAWLDPLGGVNHAVVVVGYQDDASLAAGGYWIIRNSWGTGWGDEGYGYILYGELEKHRRIHAITGDAFYVPEPGTMALISLGAVVVFVRRRRKMVSLPTV